MKALNVNAVVRRSKKPIVRIVIPLGFSIFRHFKIFQPPSESSEEMQQDKYVHQTEIRKKKITEGRGFKSHLGLGIFSEFPFDAHIYLAVFQNFRLQMQYTIFSNANHM